MDTLIRAWIACVALAALFVLLFVLLAIEETARWMLALLDELAMLHNQSPQTEENET
jgi:hypothetical protein